MQFCPIFRFFLHENCELIFSLHAALVIELFFFQPIFFLIHWMEGMLVKLESKTRFVCNENDYLSFMSMNSTIYIEKNKKRRDSTKLVSWKLGMENQNMFFVNRIACSVEDRQSLGYQSWPFFLLHTRAIPGHWGDYCSMPRLARNIFTNISTHTSLNELN